MDDQSKQACSDVEEVFTELSKTGVTFWLMSGSALGAALIGRMLPGDRDVDLGIKKSDRERITPAIGALKEKGFRVTERYDPINKEIKGMITLRRNIPFDIKLYSCNEGICWRALHKSHSYTSKLVWQCIDTAYFQNKPPIKFQKRRYRIFSYILTRAVYYLANNEKMRAAIVNKLSTVWSRLKVEYGYEKLDASWFDSFKTISFYGREVMVFENLEKYLESEYGEHWKENKEEYSSGGWLKPSHKVTSPLVITGHR